jgi:hypothetical protein
MKGGEKCKKAKKTRTECCISVSSSAILENAAGQQPTAGKSNKKKELQKAERNW